MTAPVLALPVRPARKPIPTQHVHLMLDETSLNHLSLALDALDREGSVPGGVMMNMAHRDETTVLRALVADARTRLEASL